MQQPSAEIRTEARTTCILCGSQGEPLYRNVPDAYLKVPGLWNLKKCPQPECGLIWLDPVPIKDDLHLAYATYFTHGALDGKPTFVGTLRAQLYQVYKMLNWLLATASGLQKQKLRASKI